ncbi:Serine/threonine-protein kinase [Spathaspora sp. JA1]|nr:Serine/threonine-protein kinase [Spathaspora sp. JA1]
MFENLKAFIRHGRQANDLNRKENMQRQTDVGNNNNIDVERGPPVIFNKDDDGKNLQHENPYHDPTNYVGATNHDSDITLFDIQPYQGTASTTIDVTNGNTKEIQNQSVQEGYTLLASKLVEEERKQREREMSFPNLDKYQILNHIGEGAFSVVYKARNINTGKLVAIKVLRKFQMDAAQKSAVLKEVTILRQLHHPNIVEFIEFIDSPIYYYIVQELAPGGEIFASVVKHTYLSEDLSRWVITQVAHGIRYLHEEVGIVHRDIKPENLLFYPIDVIPHSRPWEKLRKSDDPNTKRDEGVFTPGVGGGGIGRVKLADFGLSKQIWEHNTKTPCGTVGYTAPEIVRDERYSREVDMWAIGCVLYTLLCGFPPFYDERIEVLTEKVARGQYTFLQPWWDEISYEAKRCVSRLLTVDPKKRYTIDEFLNDPWIKAAPKPQQRQQPPMRTGGGLIPAPVPVKPTTEEVHQIASPSIIHPIHAAPNPNQDLYSPAAVAFRDAFDISAAVHRMEEEAALMKMEPTIADVPEEDEEEDEDGGQTSIAAAIAQQKQQQAQAQQRRKDRQKREWARERKAFDLNLGSASILERRKNKQRIMSVSS